MFAGAAVGTRVATATVASAAAPPFPDKLYCFYSDKNYAGWELKYNDTTSGNFNNPPHSGGDHHDQLSSI
jgi:hypothetical protein